MTHLEALEIKMMALKFKQLGGVDATTFEENTLADRIYHSLVEMCENVSERNNYQKKIDIIKNIVKFYY